MASAAASQLFGGSPAQIEYAAEMGLEHNLGMTCDPYADWYKSLVSKEMPMQRPEFLMPISILPLQTVITVYPLTKWWK